jgi:hypothetical protein
MPEQLVDLIWEALKAQERDGANYLHLTDLKHVTIDGRFDLVALAAFIEARQQ